MFLKLGLHQLSESLFIERFLLGLFGIAIFIKLGGLLGWGLGLDEEDLPGSLVRKRVTVKNVTAILTVVLTQTPPENFGKQLLVDLFSFGERLDACFEFKLLNLVI